MENGLESSTEDGVPQGGPLSPILSNVYLDKFDKELESRGLRFVRYADDCNIFVKSNLAAGFLEHFPYEAEHMDLEPGTRILAYTDGVTEAENGRLELYGEGRLTEDAKRLEAGLDEKTVVKRIYQSVKAFTEGHPQSDDITIMSLKV